MTYVNKMSQKLWMESPERCEEIIGQVIADTKKACWQAMEKWCEEQNEDMIHTFTEVGLYTAVRKAEPR